VNDHGAGDHKLIARAHGEAIHRINRRVLHRATGKSDGALNNHITISPGWKILVLILHVPHRRNRGSRKRWYRCDVRRSLRIARNTWNISSVRPTTVDCDSMASGTVTEVRRQVRISVDVHSRAADKGGGCGW